MKLLITIALGILYCLLTGLFAYLITITIVPEKFKQKLFSIIPFFPKLPYSIILYLLSGILYSVFIYFFSPIEQILKIITMIASVIVSSLSIKLIAKLRNENLEETYEEELERKRNL
jgi:hypothetical protein